MASDKRICLHCKQPISGDALYLLNQIAQKRHYCCWACLATALDPKMVEGILQNKREERSKRERRGGRRRFGKGIKSKETEVNYVRR